MMDLSGARVLVMGASQGIGRAFALRAVAAGAEVVLSARDEDALRATAAEAGGGHVVAADVRDDESLDALVERVRSRFGELDLVLYSVGSATLVKLADAHRWEWERSMAINVVGFNQLARRLLGTIRPGGVVAVLSSETSLAPRDGLIPYAASKAALELSVRGWQAEHPELRWSCVTVGATFPTAFAQDFDGELLGEVLNAWTRRGLMQEQFMVPDEVAAQLLALYAGALAAPSVNVDHVTVRSPTPVVGGP